MPAERQHGSTSSVLSKLKFSGTDHSQWPKFYKEIMLDLHLHEIHTDADGRVITEIHMRSYRTSKDPTKEVLITHASHLTPDDILDGLVVGEYRLFPVGLKAYRDAITSEDGSKEEDGIFTSTIKTRK